MHLHYVSPSTLPSRTANSVHVALQCEGLARAGAEITLYAKRSMPDETELLPAVRDWYGIETDAVCAVTYFSRFERADNIRIAALALSHMRTTKPRAILSRNLYASFAMAVLQRRPLLFETHQLERGSLGVMQRAIMRRPWVVTVVISNKLRQLLEQHHGAAPSNTQVLHDAAADGIVPLSPGLRRHELAALLPELRGGWGAVCGYFGHLYPGRGVEIIEAMARASPHCLFLVFGGNPADVDRKRASNRLSNLIFGGHVAHARAIQLMRAVDVLLMPYQSSVSIGVSGHDTARWMSPMKMFEYLASGVPVVSSDLDVLREILRDGENCVLVPSDDVGAWVRAVDRLVREPLRAAALGRQAHADYLRDHTWTQRGRRILQIAAAL